MLPSLPLPCRSRALPMGCTSLPPVLPVLCISLLLLLHPTHMYVICAYTRLAHAPVVRMQPRLCLSLTDRLAAQAPVHMSIECTVVSKRLRAQRAHKFRLRGIQIWVSVAM